MKIKKIKGLRKKEIYSIGLIVALNSESAFCRNIGVSVRVGFFDRILMFENVDVTYCAYTSERLND